MLRYFRINDPYRLLGLLAIMVVISLPLFIDAPEMTLPELKSILLGEKVHSGSSLYTEVVDSTAPLAGWFDALFEMIFGRSVLGRHILAFFIVFSQAAYLGIVFINKKAFSESTFIPSVIFAFLFFFSFDTLSLNAELLECLKDDPDAQAHWDTLTKGHQLYFSKWIDSAKTEATKTNRLTKTLVALSKGWGYPEMIRAAKKEKEDW